MKKIGLWWSDSSTELVQMDDGAIYALAGWNGEKYTGCWRCLDPLTPDPDGREYTLRPVYRYQVEGIELGGLEGNSDEWDAAVTIVDYTVEP